jgi:alanyl aminopeptidase
VRAFLDRHAWGSATADDFFRALGEAAGDSPRVLAALRGFVDQPGAPLIEATLDCTGHAPSVVVEQRRFRPEGTTAQELTWTAPVCFRYRVGDRNPVHCAPVDAFTRRIFLPDAPSCPAWLVGNVDGAGHYVTRYWPPQLRRIAAQAASVPSLEMQALANDTLLMARSGMLPMQSALLVAEAALRHPAPMVQFQGVRMLEDLPDGLLRPADRTQKARIVRERVIPRARELGWTPRRSDAEDERALRPDLLRFAAERPEGAELRAEARRLALRWLEDPKAVDATVAKAALEAAGRSADAATFARLEAAALATETQRERSYLLGALVRARDPALRSRALELALATSSGRERLDGRSTLTLLARALGDEEARPVAFGYVRDNVTAIEKKLPKDTLPHLFEPMGRLCTEMLREEFAQAFRERAPRYMTGEQRYAQALESIDLCVAARR